MLANHHQAANEESTQGVGAVRIEKAGNSGKHTHLEWKAVVSSGISLGIITIWAMTRESSTEEVKKDGLDTTREKGVESEGGLSR